MAYGTKVAFDPVRELDFGDISGTYTAVGTPVGEHIRVIIFNNSTDQDLYISTDGSTNELRIAANGFKLLDLSANKVKDDGLFLASGIQFYTKEVSTSVTEGSFWIEVIYAEGGK